MVRCKMTVLPFERVPFRTCCCVVRTPRDNWDRMELLSWSARESATTSVSTHRMDCQLTSYYDQTLWHG